VLLANFFGSLLLTISTFTNRGDCERLSPRDLTHGYKSSSSSHPCVREVPAPSEYRSHLLTDGWQNCGERYGTQGGDHVIYVVSEYVKQMTSAALSVVGALAGPIGVGTYNYSS
jgi:hypothetical protein